MNNEERGGGGPAGDVREQIARQALATAGQFLGAAEKVLPGLAAELRAGELKNALPELTHMLQGLGALAGLSAHLAAGGVGPIAPEEIRTILSDIVACEERGDWKGVADIVEGNVLARVAAWRAALAARPS